MKIETIIGIETHVQLNTKTKMFCSCSTDYFGHPPNSMVCPICLGYPGVLPSVNIEAFRKAIRVGKALHCDIQEKSRFDRKNYMYPDLFKGYQITQFEYPINLGGFIDLISKDTNKRINITRAHLEEDTAKSIHVDDHTLIDGNKAGTPLLEIVSEPDLSTSDEAVEYTKKLRSIIRFIGASLADMEKGEMRFDINVNLKITKDNKEFRTPITEVKNLNSFKSLKNAIEYEVERQKDEFVRSNIVLEKGNKTTRGWNDTLGKTYFLREKEESDDYRYFPEPDIPPFEIDQEFIEKSIKEIDVFYEDALSLLVEKHKIPIYTAELIIGDRPFYDFFMKSIKIYKGDENNIANWIVNDIFTLINENGISIEDIDSDKFVMLLSKVDEKSLSINNAREIFKDVVLNKADVLKLIEENSVIDDDDLIDTIVREVIDKNKDLVEKYVAGKEGLLGFFVGQVLQKVSGRYNPEEVKEKIIHYIKTFN